jgi:hypothetical protein
VICGHLQTADRLLVIASAASANSNWVGEELEFAQQQGKTVIPLFIESVVEHPRFRDLLGIDGTMLQEFADVVHAWIRKLFLSLGLEMPDANPLVLTKGLRELAREEPEIAPLIVGCLDSQGLHCENVETVCNVPVHALDEAVNVLFELKPNSIMAYHAAHLFCRTGGGARGLSSWIEATRDGNFLW